jgi:hypothetical protein
MGYSLQPEHGVEPEPEDLRQDRGPNGRRRAIRWGQNDLGTANAAAAQPPIAAENPQQLRREHDVTVLAGLTLLDPDPQSCGGEEG